MIVWSGLALAALALFLTTLAGRTVINRRYPACGRLVRPSIGPDIHVIERGQAKADRPAIVIIHGASGNARDSDEALGKPLSAVAHILSFDRPGHGWSGRARGRAAASPDHQAVRLAAALADMGIERCVLIGHSFGAAVACALALAIPQKLVGLVLIAPATHPWPGGGISWHNRVAALPIIGHLFAWLFPLPLGFFVMPKVLPDIFQPRPVPDAYAVRAGVALCLRPHSFRANARDVVDLLGHVTRLSPRYREITAPTLIIAGQNDEIVYNSLHAERLAREIAGARLVVLPDTGHMPQWTAPDETLRLMSQFYVEITHALPAHLPA